MGARHWERGCAATLTARLGVGRDAVGGHSSTRIFVSTVVTQLHCCVPCQAFDAYISVLKAAFSHRDCRCACVQCSGSEAAISQYPSQRRAALLKHLKWHAGEGVQKQCGI